MYKKDNIKTFLDEKYFSPPKKIYPTNKIVYNHIDEIWSFDLLNMSGYGISNFEGYRYILVVLDSFSKYTRCISLKNKYGHTIRDEFSFVISTTKRKPNKIESDRAREFYNIIFHTFFKLNNIHHFSRSCDKGPLVAERLNKTIRIFFYKETSFRKRKCFVDKRININNKRTPFTTQRK